MSCKTPILHSNRLSSNDVTRLREILRSGSCEPPDAPHLRDIIFSSTEQLGRYDEHIDALETLLKRRSAERRALKQYVDGCRGVFSPIRRLPPEILCEIFAMVDQGNWHGRSATIGDEMYSLKKVHLLRLSRVCAQWHGLVLNTPALWSRINVTLSHWSRTSYLTRLKGLLTLTIQRSTVSPLHVRAGVDGSPSLLPHQPALEVLAQHSERWHTAVFNIGVPLFDCMSRAKGKLPHLRILRLRTWGNKTSEFDLFEDAPRLIDVAFTGPISLMPKLPWNTLQRFALRTYITGVPEDLGAGLSLMRFCAPGTHFQFSRLDVSRQSVPLNLPAITVAISSLDLNLVVQIDPQRTRDLLGEIIDSLTLPHARSLRFSANPRTPLYWPTANFLSFLSRSACHNLHVLDLEAVISADELFQCLSVLPELSALTLSDCPVGPINHILLTDDVFRRLTWTADAPTCLVPKLALFRCTTRLRFSSDVFVDFVRSRVGTGRLFKVDLCWFPDSEVGHAARTQSEELQRRPELRFSIIRRGRI
ncbi:hypothetical protein DFH07DRAFT_1064682 [Mycena maculata]|uniref:F-box domain-containing protein n=1 Tax=Mycena maculata TaxID=230809 RepID=A0AAD7MZM8_9AGAR|nr:hypothetical protein DFH07DRAFT_1064682 [Mycena maculata]